MADYDIYEGQGGGYSSLQEQPFPLEDDVSRLIFGDNGRAAVDSPPSVDSDPEYFNPRLNQVGVRTDLDPRFYLSARRQVEVPEYELQQPGTQCLTQPCQPEYDPSLLTTNRLRPEDIMRIIMAANGQYVDQSYQTQWNNPQYPIYQPGRVPPSQVQAYQLIRALLDRQGVDSRGMYPSDYPNDPTYINQQPLRFMPQSRCVPQQQFDPRFPQGIDPRFLRQFEPAPRGSQTFDPRFPQTYDPRINQVVYDPRYPQRSVQQYDPRYPQYDPRYPQYDPRYPQYDPRNPQYDPRYPQYDPRNPQYDPRYPQYDPRYPDPRYQVDPRYRIDPRYQPCDQGGCYPGQNSNLGRQLLLRYGVPLLFNAIGGRGGYRGGYPGGFGGGGWNGGGWNGGGWNGGGWNGGGWNRGYGNNFFPGGGYNRGWGGGGGRGYIQLGRFGIRL